MSIDLAEMNSAVMDLDEISYVLSKVTLVDKLIFSGVTKEEVRTALTYCNSDYQLDKWMESVLKHWVQEPKNNAPHWDVNLRSKAVRRNLLRMFENSNLFTQTNYRELRKWSETL